MLLGRAWVLGVVLVGCTSSGTPGDAGHVADAAPFRGDVCRTSANQTPSLELGLGQLSFHSLTQEQDVDWEAGPQGGHHIWAALRGSGLHQSGTVLHLEMTDVQDTTAPVTLLDRRVVFAWSRDPAGAGCVMAGLRMQLDESPDVRLTDLDGHRVRIRVTATDADGAEAFDSKVVVVHAPVTATDGGM